MTRGARSAPVKWHDDILKGEWPILKIGHYTKLNLEGDELSSARRLY